MRVTKRLDHALRALVELARLDSGERLSVAGLSLRLSLPRRFLEQQITELSRKGLIECRRGPAGGCRLSRSADEINVADVALELEGTVLDRRSDMHDAVSLMWTEVADTLKGVMAAVTVADLAHIQDEIERREQHMYFI
ncbi:MAG: Rrf2 family transcriptional regulator [Actinomycetota bacterium]|jgi:Rrf2 family protein|nr:Rrf2 family transcriptional regulator [Actinomycetota bacterium]